MREWKKDEFLSNEIWYHATTWNNAVKIIENGVNVKVNIDRALDFGYGFYITPNFKWAKHYLNDVLLTSDENDVVRDNDGVILKIRYCPIEDAQNYKIMFWDALDIRFAKFVFKNRMHYKRHILKKCVHSYDLVGGPMSDGNQIDDFNSYQMGRITRGELFERLLQPKDDWQLLIHSQSIADKLLVVSAYNTKGEEIDVSEIHL